MGHNLQADDSKLGSRVLVFFLSFFLSSVFNNALKCCREAARSGSQWSGELSEDLPSLRPGDSGSPLSIFHVGPKAEWAVISRTPTADQSTAHRGECIAHHPRGLGHEAKASTL